VNCSIVNLATVVTLAFKAERPEEYLISAHQQ
jgi:hypothetical protein